MKKPKMLDERDVRAAYARFHMDADRFMARVKQAQAERELEECSKEIDRLTAECGALVGTGQPAEFLRIGEQIDRQFKRHRKLLDLAYPLSGTQT